MADDFYDTLGVSRDASDADIKSAYRKLAMKYHPDRNQGDAASEQKFKDVSQAYEILKDPKKRQTYDQFGHAAFEQGGGALAVLVNKVLVVFLIYLKTYLELLAKVVKEKVAEMTYAMMLRLT